MADKHQISISTEVEGADTEETCALIRSTIATALAAQGVEVPCEIDVLLSDDAGIHAINLDMRGVDRPTDVLSFPMFDLTPGEKPQEEWADPDSGCVPLGDMVLSLERVPPRPRSTATAGSGSSPTWWCTRCSTCWATTTWTRDPRRPRCGSGRTPLWRKLD